MLSEVNTKQLDAASGVLESLQRKRLTNLSFTISRRYLIVLPGDNQTILRNLDCIECDRRSGAAVIPLLTGRGRMMILPMRKLLLPGEQQKTKAR